MKYTNKTGTTIFHIYPKGQLFTFKAIERKTGIIKFPEPEPECGKIFLSKKECLEYLKGLYGKMVRVGDIVVNDHYFGNDS